MLLIIAIGCTKEEEVVMTPTPSSTITPEPTPKYVDDNPITVGIYYKNKLVHEYNGKFKDNKDLAVFDIVYTNEENLGNGSFKSFWNKYYQQYENIDQYKIGFYMEFQADGKKETNLILDPSAKYVTSPYIYIYLYDAVHQKDGARYTHLDMKDVKDNTIYSTIKLYMCEQTKKITSPITLTVFTYKDANDFDEDNNYRGNSSYTITIYNK